MKRKQIVLTMRELEGIVTGYLLAREEITYEQVSSNNTRLDFHKSPNDEVVRGVSCAVMTVVLE